MARPHVTPPEPIDLTDQRIQIGDTTAFVTKFNTTQDAFERFSEATGPYAEQLNALGEYLEQRADSAEDAARSTAADHQAVADDKAAVATDRQAVSADKTAVATDRAAVESAANQVATDQQTVAADKAAVATDRAAVESAASQVASDASAAAESASSASSSAQTAAQLRDQTQALRDQAEAIVITQDLIDVINQAIEDNTWLGATPVTVDANVNFNDLVSPGIYLCQGGVNSPVNSEGVLVVYPNSHNGFKRQEFKTVGEDYCRSFNNASSLWGYWSRVVSSDNLLEVFGSENIGKSFLNDVVEYGANSNGYYYKFSFGLMACFGSFKRQMNKRYSTDRIYFPASFNEFNPSVFISGSDSGANNSAMNGMQSIAVKFGPGSYMVVYNSYVYDRTSYFKYAALGRWYS